MFIATAVTLVLSAVSALFIAFYHFGEVPKVGARESQGSFVLDLIVAFGAGFETFMLYIAGGFWLLIWGVGMLELVLHVNHIAFNMVPSALVMLTFAYLFWEGFKDMRRHGADREGLLHLALFSFNVLTFGFVAVQHVIT